MTRIAFIGLGIMGSPMAVHLQHAGFDVVGFNRSDGKYGPLREAGGTSAESIAAAVADADIVATMVPDSPDVEAVLLGENGVFANAKPGTLVIDFSTIRPDVSGQLAKTAHEHGLRLVDAPVSGGEAGAKNAALSIMVGGTTEDFSAARPVFDAVGKTIVHVGEAGSGQTVKAANQLLVAGHIGLLAEAIVFLEKYDVDTTAAVEVLGGGLAGSAVLNQKSGNMTDRVFDPGFRIDLHHKDLGIFTEAAREKGVVAPQGALVAQLFAAARQNGLGDLDHSALFTLIAKLSGRH